MTKKGSHILLLLFATLTILSVTSTYYQYVEQRDFVIINDVTDEMLEEME